MNKAHKSTYYIKVNINNKSVKLKKCIKCNKLGIYKLNIKSLHKACYDHKGENCEKCGICLVYNCNKASTKDFYLCMEHKLYLLNITLIKIKNNTTKCNILNNGIICQKYPFYINFKGVVTCKPHIVYKIYMLRYNKCSVVGCNRVCTVSNKRCCRIHAKI